MADTLYCSNCKQELPEDAFTRFERNQSLSDRNGRVIVCKECCSQYVEERGNTKQALREICRMIDIPYLETYAKTALTTYKKKLKGTNVIKKQNVYDGTETESIETNKHQLTVYTCYSSTVGLIPQKYINYSCSDGLREDEKPIEKVPQKIADGDKETLNNIALLKKWFTEKIYDDKERLAKAVKLKLDELSLHKNETNARQQKFKIKKIIEQLVDANVLDKSLYGFMFDDVEESKEESEGLEYKIEFKLPSDFNLEKLTEKWGYGYTAEQLWAFEKKYQMLKNNYPEKTALHTEALLTYIRYRVNEEMATARGDVKTAKDWGDLASKQATNAKINVAQLSKSDLSDGLDSFGTLVKAVETAVDIIPVLPKFKSQPQDRVDFTLWQYINYIRDMKGLPPAEYEDIYKFYEDRKKEYEKRFGELESKNEGDNDGGS